MGVKMMSMFGSVTDAQVFSRELTDREMIEMTDCRFVQQNKSSCHLNFPIRTFLTGNILSWERETWNLTSPNNSSQLEILDFEKDVCSRPKVLSRDTSKLRYREDVCSRLASC